MRQKREEMKPVLKAILISSSVVLLLMGSFFLVAWMDSKEDSSDSEGFIDETKFPLTGYLYKESPKEEKITIEAKKEEPKDTLAELSTLKETISKKTTAYTMDIFPRDDGELASKNKNDNQCSRKDLVHLFKSTHLSINSLQSKKKLTTVRTDSRIMTSKILLQMSIDSFALSRQIA